MMTGWPQRSRNFSATMRGSASAEPPGGNGTTKVTARDGYLASCAVAAPIGASSARIAARTTSRILTAYGTVRFLLRLDAGFLDPLAPQRGLVGKELCRFRGTVGAGLQRQAFQPLRDFGAAQHFHRVAVDPMRQRGRGAGRRDEAEPRD